MEDVTSEVREQVSDARELLSQIDEQLAPLGTGAGRYGRAGTPETETPGDYIETARLRMFEAYHLLGEVIGEGD